MGVCAALSSPEAVEVLAASGLDFTLIDQMYTSTDWMTTANMIRAAQARGMSTLIRPEANPWVGAGGNAGQIASETIRALGVGATGVCASVHSPDELKAMLESGKDWHRQHHVVPFAGTPQNGEVTTWPEHEAAVRERTMIVPLFESQTTLDQFERMLEVEGLEAAMFAGSDGSRVLGLGLNYEHPTLWNRIDEVVKICERRGIVLGSGTGHAFQTAETIGKRIKRMVDHGLKIILIQTDGAMLQFMMQSIFAVAKAELGSEFKPIGDRVREMTGRS
ncbi:MAG TPA: hypothetical protein VGG22_07465 [Candidatus Baltobacteraceae bacterium]